MDDETAWKSGVGELFPLIHTGEVELIGLLFGKPLARQLLGTALALVRVLPPLSSEIPYLNSPSHIVCSPFMDQEHWERRFNDKLYESGRVGPTWTHLQVRKNELLNRWPKPNLTTKSLHDCREWLEAQMRRTPTAKPKSKKAFWAEAKEMFLISHRQFNRAWDNAVTETGANWSHAGAPKRSGR